ncbi:E3 ubiquitin-protein like [Actinidia chinensis var. chinensis]|uniref:RING-type E3 ubiquitin transferase n=1 Tax=Actinidia chinensis var. chinensis TaxID=1590841 RepID=A0A2R6PE17_ACTCC|nr:E3 ubiquitin-protein like [Actinidia chinensis var. chinensis]
MSTNTDYPFRIVNRYVTVSNDQFLEFNVDNPIHVELSFINTPHDQPLGGSRVWSVLDHDELQSRDTALSSLSPIFCLMGIPDHVQSSLVDRVSTSSRAMTANSIRRVDSRVIPGIMVFVWVGMRVSDDEADSVALAIAESFGVAMFEPVLEKVVVRDGLGSVDGCAICLDEFHVGSEVIRMPCSHVYHDDCIVSWLKTSNSCPLCRYEMPSSSF